MVTFTGENGIYDIKFTSIKETDGESTYRILVNDEEIGTFQNPETEVDYELSTYTLESIGLEKGEQIGIEFNSHSNGKIPEGEGYAYSRGRWKEIAFYLVD